MWLLVLVVFVNGFCVLYVSPVPDHIIVLFSLYPHGFVISAIFVSRPRSSEMFAYIVMGSRMLYVLIDEFVQMAVTFGSV